MMPRDTLSRPLYNFSLTRAGEIFLPNLRLVSLARVQERKVSQAGCRGVKASPKNYLLQ